MIHAEVKLWNKTIGAVTQDEQSGRIRFNYTDEFIEFAAPRGIQLSPITMPINRTVYDFSELADSGTFRGLPGLLADSMPDKFGNKIIRKYLEERGINDDDFGAVERLLYTGQRGMGALEYEPVSSLVKEYEDSIDLEKLVKCASDILAERENFKLNSDEVSMSQILAVGTSAGGARAKAVISWNRETNDIRSGQIKPLPGYEHWLIKFDGIQNNKDEGDLEPDPKCLTRIEYAYYLMAQDCGIPMMQSTLKEENGFYHFMTKRFDRTDQGEKLHMQTLGAIAHFDLKNNAGTNSYEQAGYIIRRMELGQKTLDQFFRRGVFNICGRNHDDHVKNTSFLMNKQGQWSLSPAYDLTYSYKPGGRYTNTHHLSLNGKLENHTLEDLLAFGKSLDIREGKAKAIISEVQDAISQWEKYSNLAKVPEELSSIIAKQHIFFNL